MSSPIDRTETIRAWCNLTCGCEPEECGMTIEQDGAECCSFVEFLENVPSYDRKKKKVEPLTDKEQRIFLAAMGREEKVCAEVDRNYTREPYEDSLLMVCKEIERKVKGALWEDDEDE